ncbi:MAG: hypothetical protein ACOC5G_00140 [Acidobacteriota bacterium]
MASKIKCYAVAFTVLLLISPLFAENPKLSLHINGGLCWMLKKNIDSGLKTGFGFSVPVVEKTTLTFDFGFWKSGVQEETGGLYDGTLTMAPFQASLYYTLFETRRFAPYVFGGTGIVFSHFKAEDIISIPEVSIDQKVNNGISLHAGAGSFLKINKRIAFYGEACFFYRKGEGSTTYTDMNFGKSTKNFSLDLSSLVFSIGIKYYL